MYDPRSDKLFTRLGPARRLFILEYHQQWEAVMCIRILRVFPSALLLLALAVCLAAEVIEKLDLIVEVEASACPCR